jgi:glycosyltransferase involved in cell wall biosynthesis
VPKVSVIIPAYNRANCIQRAIQSVQTQTCKDVEIIVIDDGSTDNTSEVVKSIPDNRIRYIGCKANRGAGAARNEGLKAAKGSYIAFLDSDDEWLPEKLARQVERMDSKPSEIGVCICGAHIIKNGNPNDTAVYSPDIRSEHAAFRKFVMGQIMIMTPTVLFRRSCLEKTGLMVPEMRRNQDGEFLLRLLCHFGLSVISEPYVVVHLVVSSSKKVYDAINFALPYRLQHYKMIRDKLGYWPALQYKCLLRHNSLCAAIRERSWPEILRDFWRRFQEFPLLFPREIKMILKAFIARYSRRQG